MSTKQPNIISNQVIPKKIPHNTHNLMTTQQLSKVWYTSNE